MMNVATITATATGPSAPIAMLGQSVTYGVSGGQSLPVAPRYQLQPTVFVTMPAGQGTGAATLEITCDQPDAGGNFPSPGTWVPWSDDPRIAAGNFFNQPVAVAVKNMFTGIRANVSFVAVGGSIRLAVVQ